MQPDSELGAPARSTAGVVLELVRTGRATTRADLRRLTGLSRTAVIARVAALVPAACCCPARSWPPPAAAPRPRWTVNPDAGVVLAVAVGRSRSQVGVFDLAARSWPATPSTTRPAPDPTS